MVYGNVQELEKYGFLGEKILNALRYAMTHDLECAPRGRNEVDGDELYFNKLIYTTEPARKRMWEAHVDYIDVHYSLSGCEEVDLASLVHMKTGDYDKDADFLRVVGNPDATCIMRPGDFLVCMPNDAHRPGVIHQRPCEIRKVVFKVKL